MERIADHRYAAEMKRDMELIRTILLKLEEAESPSKKPIAIDGTNQATVGYHYKLLIDAGFLKHDIRKVKANQVHSGGHIDLGFDLTWEGHEFLDTIRDPEIWRKTKDGATQVGSWSVGLLAELGKGLIKAKAIELGLPIT